MDNPVDFEKTVEVIEKMMLAKIGKYKKWESMIKKIKSYQKLNPEESEYYSNLTRIYKDSNVTARSKVYHTKLSEMDEKPP